MLNGWDLAFNGSRDVDGNGVYVNANGEKLNVNWNDPTNDNPNGGARSEVSLLYKPYPTTHHFGD